MELGFTQEPKITKLPVKPNAFPQSDRFVGFRWVYLWEHVITGRKFIVTLMVTVHYRSTQPTLLNIALNCVKKSGFGNPSYRKSCSLLIWIRLTEMLRHRKETSTRLFRKCLLKIRWTRMPNNIRTDTH